MHRLLLVDDDTEILSINSKYFAQNDYEVKTASNAAEGLSMVKSFQPECIVLDVMMPDVDGFQACKKYRTITKVPIIFLTGKTSENDKIKGFQLGADDYLEKPYSLRELSARILANIRRSQSYSAPSSMTFGSLSINVIEHAAYYNKEIIPLSNREYELLYLLASQSNTLVTFKDIGEQMWGSYSDTDRRSVMVHISRLRKKLEAYHELIGIIETVWSKGYQFVWNTKEV